MRRRSTVRRLVRQLDAPQLAQRDAAEQELIKLGPDVLDLLPTPTSRDLGRGPAASRPSAPQVRANGGRVGRRAVPGNAARRSDEAVEMSGGDQPSDGQPDRRLPREVQPGEDRSGRQGELREDPVLEGTRRRARSGEADGLPVRRGAGRVRGGPAGGDGADGADGPGLVRLGSVSFHPRWTWLPGAGCAIRRRMRCGCGCRWPGSRDWRRSR